MPKSAQPQIAVRLRTYEVQYPDFAPVFHWLIRYAGLNSKQIAAAFLISDARVRKICERHPFSRQSGPLISELDYVERVMLHRPLIVVPTAHLRHELGISEAPDFVDLTKHDRAAIEMLAAKVEADSAQAIATGKVEDGLAQLRLLTRRLGRPQSAVRIRLLARVRHQSAWLLIHLGRTRSAIDQARRSMALSAVAFQESNDRIDQMRLAETAQVLSMAYAMRNSPEHSLNILAMVRKTYHALGAQPGAEYHRQVGTGLLLLGNDEEAEQQFAIAAAKMRQAGAPEAEVLLLALRQANILNGAKWNSALETVSITKESLSTSVIAYQTNLNWAAVTGLATERPSVVDDALQLLGPKPQTFYGHQATIRLLIEITPRLGLTGRTLTRWTRYLMYANLYQDD